MNRKFVFGNWYFHLQFLKCRHTKMRVLPLFKIAIRFLTSKVPKLLSTLLAQQNGAMIKSCFSTRQNAENEH